MFKKILAFSLYIIIFKPVHNVEKPVNIGNSVEETNDVNSLYIVVDFDNRQKSIEASIRAGNSFISVTVDTNRHFTVSHFQTSGSVNVWFEQDGRTASFDACKDGGYIGRFAPAFNDMVFVASLWGGGGIDMGWLDGMTGCGGDCNLGASSVAFSNFNIW